MVHTAFQQKATVMLNPSLFREKQAESLPITLEEFIWGYVRSSMSFLPSVGGGGSVVPLLLFTGTRGLLV